MNLHAKLLSLGWKREHQGGGCEAFALHVGGFHLLISEQDSPCVPELNAVSFFLSVAPEGQPHEEATEILTATFLAS